MKQTCNPDNKPGDQPVVRATEIVAFTDSDDIFLLKQQADDLIKQWTYSDSMGSQRVRILEIKYVGATT